MSTKKEIYKQGICVFGHPFHSFKPFLDREKFDCFEPWSLIDSDFPRPFLAIQNVRNLKKSIPYGCNPIHDESFKLLFNEKNLITGRILICT